MRVALGVEVFQPDGRAPYWYVSVTVAGSAHPGSRALAHGRRRWWMVPRTGAKLKAAQVVAFDCGRPLGPLACTHMSELPPPPPPPPPPPGRVPGGRGLHQNHNDGAGNGNDPQKRTQRPGFPRWTPWVLVGLVLALLFGQQLLPSTDREKLDYNEFLEQVQEGNVQDFTVNNSTLAITGHFTAGDRWGQGVLHDRAADGARATPTVRSSTTPSVKYTFKTPSSNFFVSLIPPALAVRADHRVPDLDAATCPGPDGQRDVDRSQPGQGVHDRPAEHDVRRRRRLRGRQAGDQGGRRLPAHAGTVQGDRRPGAQGHPARRSSRHRQDAVRPGRGR